VTARLCFVVLDHRNDRYFADLVRSLRAFCPDAEVFWYDSGATVRDPVVDGVRRMPVGRRLQYAKVTPFFFDMFEWAVDQGYDYVVNAESDMAFIQPGYERFLDQAMRDVDYLSPGFSRATPRTSRWRPYRSLRSELPELMSILGIDYTNGCFSPGQVFSAKYISTLLASPLYGRIRAFVEGNQLPGRSFTLQEVLLPTLADVLGLAVQDYPPYFATFNRYRPYHGRHAVSRALDITDVHFIHPVRRAEDDPARQAARTLASFDPSMEPTGGSACRG